MVRLLHAEALRASGALDEARAAIVEARDRLYERAQRIGDREMRRGMLERVKSHARTIALADEWTTS